MLETEVRTLVGVNHPTLDTIDPRLNRSGRTPSCGAARMGQCVTPTSESRASTVCHRSQARSHYNKSNSKHACSPPHGYASASQGSKQCHRSGSAGTHQRRQAHLEQRQLGTHRHQVSIYFGPGSTSWHLQGPAYAQRRSVHMMGARLLCLRQAQRISDPTTQPTLLA